MGLLGLYQAQFRTTAATHLQYRVESLIWLFGGIVEPTVYLVVWSTVAESSGGRLGTYTSGGFAAYFAVMMLVEHLTFSWIMHEYEYRVRMGLLSFVLLRPVHPIHADIVDNLTYKLMSLIFLLPVAAFLMWAFHAEFAPPLWAVLAFVPALALAFLLRFLMEWTLAMAAFWTTRVSALNQTYYVAVLFFSGQIAPLSLLPGPLADIASVLPFRWFVSFPVELVLGRLTPAETAAGYLAQAAWLAAALVLVRRVWRAGVKRYTAVGG